MPRKKAKFFAIAVCLMLVAACGDDLRYNETVPTQTSPFVNRIDPATGPAGTVVTVFGFGFSAVPEYNIVFFGATPAFATNYSLVSPPAAGEIEALTVTVPAGVAVGNSSVFVSVFDNVSNTNVNFNGF